MTVARDLIIRAGQTFELSLPYAGTAGRGQRAHIRWSDGTATVVQILTHNGDTNARVLFNGTDAIDITIGASVSAAWVVGAMRVEWVYDIEDYDLSDVDDVIITHSGKCIVYGNRTRESDVTPSDQMPSGDGRYVRFDGEQGLSAEQQLQARENIGATLGSGDVVGPASATDGRIAEFDGTTGKLIKQSSYTAANLIAAAAAAAPVQSVAGRTGSVVIAVGDVSGAEASANKAQANGYASLDSGGKVPQAQIPAIAITEYLGDVASQAAMLALSGQKGDWCTRSDTGATWIITGTDPTLIGSWTSVTYPASPVTSVAGRTGAVTLSTSDVSGLGTAATHNVPASGNAASGEVVKGSDTRLDVAATTHAATAKTTPVDADEFPLIDSAALNVLKKLSWANLKVTAKTYFDTLYQTILVSGTNIKTINSTSLLGAGDIAISASPAGSDTQMQFNNAGAFAGSPLHRTDANTIEQKNGTAAQTLLLYNTVSGSNYERAFVRFVSGEMRIGNEFGGSGNARSIRILQSGGTYADGIILQVNSATTLSFYGYGLFNGAGLYSSVGALTLTTPDVVGFSVNAAHTSIKAGAAWAYAGNNANGGSVKIDAGAGYGTGADGEVVVGETRGVLRVKQKAIFEAAAKLAAFTVATVPSASLCGAGSSIFVSNESGGAVVAFSDGTDWRRVTDRAVIS